MARDPFTSHQYGSGGDSRARPSSSYNRHLNDLDEEHYGTAAGFAGRQYGPSGASRAHPPSSYGRRLSDPEEEYYGAALGFARRPFCSAHVYDSYHSSLAGREGRLRDALTRRLREEGRQRAQVMHEMREGNGNRPPSPRRNDRQGRPDMIEERAMSREELLAWRVDMIYRREQRARRLARAVASCPQGDRAGRQPSQAAPYREHPAPEPTGGQQRTHQQPDVGSNIQAGTSRSGQPMDEEDWSGETVVDEDEDEWLMVG